MNLSYQTIQDLCERFDWQAASEYGEPGYSTRGETPLVVLGNYWCRCDKIEGLHSYENHWPKVFRQMEAQGVEFEWDDEWVIDYETDKAYRTSGDCYQWQSSVSYTESGDMLTPDNDLEEWVEEMVNNPRKCLPSQVWSGGDLEEAGWESWNGTYESGWHPDQTDDPKVITREIRDAMGNGVDVLFLLDEASQFYIGFSAWTRERVEENDD